MKLTYQQTAAPRTCLGVDSDTYNGTRIDMLLLLVLRPIALSTISDFLTVLISDLLTHDNADPLAILYGDLNSNSDAKGNPPQENASLASPPV